MLSIAWRMIAARPRRTLAFAPPSILMVRAPTQRGCVMTVPPVQPEQLALAV